MELVVIPAYNEEKRIGRVIRGLFEHGHTNILVVDDGSTDRTVQISKDFGIKVLVHPINRGQGAALETGNLYARMNGYQTVVHFDADGQFNPADILPAINFLKDKNLDVVLGSRFLDERSKIPFFKKTILLPVSRWINYVFTGVLLTDVHNGFRIFSEKALKNINITQDRMSHNTEILQKINKNKLKYAEFPVEVKYHEYGQGVGGGIKILRDIIISFFC